MYMGVIIHRYIYVLYMQECDLKLIRQITHTYILKFTSRSGVCYIRRIGKFLI